jgi:hypothetical protein
MKSRKCTVLKHMFVLKRTGKIGVRDLKRASDALDIRPGYRIWLAGYLADSTLKVGEYPATSLI